MIGVPQSLDELAAYEASSKALLPEDYASIGVHREYLRKFLDSSENPLACRIVEHIFRNVESLRSEIRWESWDGVGSRLRVASSICESSVEIEEITVDLVLTVNLRGYVELTKKLVILIFVDTLASDYSNLSQLRKVIEADGSGFLGAIYVSTGFGYLPHSPNLAFSCLNSTDLFRILHESCLGGMQLEMSDPSTALRSKTPGFVTKWVTALAAEVARLELVEQANKLLGDAYDGQIARRFGYRSWEHFAFYLLKFFAEVRSFDIREAKDPALSFSFYFVDSWDSHGPSLRLYLSPIMRRIVADAPKATWSLSVEVSRLKFRIHFDNPEDSQAINWSAKYSSAIRQCAISLTDQGHANQVIDDNQSSIIYSWNIYLSDRGSAVQHISEFLSGLYRHDLISHREFEWYRNAD